MNYRALISALICFVVIGTSFKSFAVSPVRGSAGAPLNVQADSSVTVMEYDPWFGPIAQGFPGKAVPLTHSANMSKGYDSLDPKVIQTHIEQMTILGIDAVMVDLSNGIMCSFSSDLSDCHGSTSERDAFASMKLRALNLYPSFAQARTPLKIIPILGADSDQIFRVDSSGRPILQKQFDQWFAMMDQYPQLNVIEDGKPLITIFMGAAQGTGADALWRQVQSFFQSHYQNRATLRLMAGMFDDQPSLWKNPGERNTLHELNAAYPFWSWIDRYNPGQNIFPSFLKSSTSGRVENFTIAAATPGRGNSQDPNQANSWGNPVTGQYNPTAGLRRGGATLTEMVNLAISLKPQFLIINQWNNFQGSWDSGYDQETIPEVEPNTVQGTQIFDQLKRELARYRAAIQMPRAGFIRVQGGAFNWNGADAVCSVISPNHYSWVGGNQDVATLPAINQIPDGIRQDGPCQFQVPAGFYFINGAVIISNGQGHSCSLVSPEHYRRAGGTAEISTLRVLPFIPSTLKDDGTCAGSPATSQPAPPPSNGANDRQTLERMWKAGDHLYTLNRQEGLAAGYSPDAQFQVWANAGIGGRKPIFRCYSSGEHFVSLAENCEGQTKEGSLGFLGEANTVGGTALYSLRNDGDGRRLLSNDPNEGAAQGFQMKQLLGYAP